MNELISFNFDFAADEEQVDFFVSFLKSLTLKLNEETVNFFFNDKFKTFPLYHQAIQFYNHKEPMIRTSVRTITLTIFNSKPCPHLSRQPQNEGTVRGAPLLLVLRQPGLSP